MNGADVFVKALEQEGVEYIFGVPGEENLDLVESLRNSKIKLIVTRHEQGAGFMAATYGRLTGKIGVCLATLGPGAINLMTAVAYSQLGAMPMLVITGQKPIKSSKQGQFQIIDTVDMMRPITKHTKQIVNTHSIPCDIRNAVRMAEDERPGAVHLELPEDIAEEATDAKLIMKHDIDTPEVDIKFIKQAAQMIERANKPLILIGANANRKGMGGILREFIDHTGIPFFDTQMGKGVVDERHDLFLGTAALSDNDYLHCAIHRADLIINIGHDVVEKPPFLMNKTDFKVIHINYSMAQLDEVYFPHCEVVGDIGYSIAQLKDKLTPQDHWDFGGFTSIKTQIENHIHDCDKVDTFPMLPQRLVADVREVMPEDGIITLDNGMYKIWFARNYYAYQSNTILLDNALATMGAGLPSAIGAKLVYPDRKVVAICGDGGFMMNSQEMETAVRLGIDLVVIVIEDSGYGMIKWKQDIMKHPRFGLDFNNPDFIKYAESYGAHGHAVSDTKEFAGLLEKSLNDGGVHLIAVPIDYSQNKRVLIDELYEKTCAL